MLLIGETSAPPPSGAFFWGTIANEPRQGSGLTTFRAWVRPSPQNYELVACPVYTRGGKLGQSVGYLSSKLFCWSRFWSWGRHRIVNQCQATFKLQGRLHPGLGHFPQNAAMPFRFGLVGPSRAFLRELTKFFGRCRHGALPRHKYRSL
jgi:hypothetical protein